MKYYLETVEDVFKKLNSGEEGLSSAQAEARLEKEGHNKLREAKKESLINRFFKQLLDPMILILVAAALISAFMAFYEKKFPTDVLIILSVVLINSILGVYQESKAEKAIEALQKMSAATSKVLRDGNIKQLKSEDLVRGDLILLEAGDAVPADCRIIEAAGLKIEEAALTGESVAVKKHSQELEEKDGLETALGDRRNMAYMGTSVAYGRGRALVVETGMNTEVGKIAHAIETTKQGLTPLQIKLNRLSKSLSFLVIAVSVFIFAFQFFMRWQKGGTLDFAFTLEIFLVAVSLAVAAIPEGLVAVVTIVLSMGVTRMSRQNAIIRKLTAVETLGSAQVICSDKTGTLTQNVMTVVESYAENTDLLAKAMTLCTDAEVLPDGEVAGEPTEAALVKYGLKQGFSKNDLKAQFKRVGEAPFDSERKMMTTLHEDATTFVQYTKGAPDEILKRCELVLTKEGAVPLTEALHEKILLENKGMTGKALRVLAAAYKEYRELPLFEEASELEQDMVFIGLVGMIDPVRPEVGPAIEKCRSAGIRPVMITGDHLGTAVAIAKELGIIEDESQAMTGAELTNLNDSQFEGRVESTFVYARVKPEHKTRIVTAWKNRGKVTAMTGDGVNDAPSIKSADIGIGMGITGTDVTKNVADMVLADDNFATIVTAVGEGRRIYDNIRKAVQFLLGSNLSEVLSIFMATLMNFSILRPVHLLWINLITDSFPALALGMEGAEEDIMQRKPRPASSGIFSGGLGIDVLYQGALVSLLTLAAYFLGERLEKGIWQIAQSDDGMTMAFLTMSMAEIFHSFNMRSQRHSVISMGFKGSHNKFLYLAALVSLVLTTAVIYIPFLSEAFGFTPINLTEYALAMGLALFVIPLVELVKVLQRAFERRRK